jgi:hypothetical protein
MIPGNIIRFTVSQWINNLDDLDGDILVIKDQVALIVARSKWLKRSNPQIVLLTVSGLIRTDEARIRAVIL